MTRKKQETRTLNVTSRLGVLNDHMPLEDLEAMLVQIREREDFKDHVGVGVRLDFEQGYYDDIEVQCYIEGSRPETDEEVAMREKSENHRQTLELEQLRRRIAYLEGK